MCKITTAFQNTHSKMKTNTRLWMYTPNGTVWCPFCLVKSSISWFRDEIISYISRAGERIGGVGQRVGSRKMDCVRGIWEHAPRKFWSFTCSEVCSGGFWGIHTCKLPSSFSSFRSKTMTYRALASGPRSSYIRQKCALKFASEQHKCETGWLERHGVHFAVLLISSQPVFSALRLCCSDANFNTHFILSNSCADHYYTHSSCFSIWNR